MRCARDECDNNKTETDYEDCNRSRVHQVFQVAAHIVGFRVVLHVDLVLRVVNGVLVAVIVHSICIPNNCMFHIAKTGLLRCCLYTLSSNAASEYSPGQDQDHVRCQPLEG